MEEQQDPTAEDVAATPSFDSQPDSFHAVYYSQQVPANLDSLTLLGLIFDRIIFPGVYLPTTEFEEEALIAEINRIAVLPLRMDVDDRRMLQCMEFSLHLKYLRDFCIFTGNPGYIGIMEPGANQLMMTA